MLIKSKTIQKFIKLYKIIELMINFNIFYIKLLKMIYINLNSYIFITISINLKKI